MSISKLKFGVNTLIWSDRFGPEQFQLLDRIREAGFDGVEVFMADPAPFRNPQVRKALAGSGLEVTVCCIVPNGLSMISEDAAIRQKTISHLRTCLATISEIGSKLVAGPLYAPVGYFAGRRRTEEEWRNAVDSFQQLAPALDEFGVSLAIEPLNRYETYFLNTADDAVALCDQIAHPKIGMLFDTYHANIEEKNIAEAIVRSAKHLLHFHSCENDRGIPGSGHIDWSAVFSALREIDYRGWLTIESFGFSIGAISVAASIWRDLAPSSEAIAFDGLNYLRAQAERLDSRVQNAST